MQAFFTILFCGKYSTHPRNKQGSYAAYDRQMYKKFHGLSMINVDG